MGRKRKRKQVMIRVQFSIPIRHDMVLEAIAKQYPKIGKRAFMRRGIKLVVHEILERFPEMAECLGWSSEKFQDFAGNIVTVDQVCDHDGYFIDKVNQRFDRENDPLLGPIEKHKDPEIESATAGEDFVDPNIDF